MQHSPAAAAEANANAGLPISSNAPSNFTCEIEEISSNSMEIPARRLPAVTEGAHEGTAVAFSSNGGCDDDVYVAVGKGNSSMDALSWALKHIAWKPSSFVYLIHVFPEVHQIPTPIGMLPKNQVTAQQVETHMSTERSKRREVLTKFLNLCSASKVQVDTLLIESDLITKAVLDLIPVMNIRRLIVGAMKSNLRMLRRGKGKAGQIHRGAPDYCHVSIICEGKEVLLHGGLSPSPPPTPKNSKNKEEEEEKEDLQRDHDKHFLSCTCFSRKFL